MIDDKPVFNEHEHNTEMQMHPLADSHEANYGLFLTLSRMHALIHSFKLRGKKTAIIKTLKLFSIQLFKHMRIGHDYFM